MTVQVQLYLALGIVALVELVALYLQSRYLPLSCLQALYFQCLWLRKQLEHLEKENKVMGKKK